MRTATLRDLPAMTGLCTRLAGDYYPDMTPDRKRLEAAVSECVSSPASLALTAGPDGILLATGTRNMWARKDAVIVNVWWACRPGLGRALLRHFKGWVAGRANVRVAGFMVDSDMIDPRSMALAGRMGFTRRGGAFLAYRSEMIEWDCSAR